MLLILLTTKHSVYMKTDGQNLNRNIDIKSFHIHVTMLMVYLQLFFSGLNALQVETEPTL